MHIEIDQSGKIEQTNLDTVVAFRNSEQYSVLLEKKIKVEILNEYRNRYKDIHYRLFAILAFYCIRNYLPKIELIIVDIEYEGRDEDIKRNLLRLIWKIRPNFDKKIIRFSPIGKKSSAHKLAYQTFAGKLAPNQIITKKEVEKAI